jgi:hypothetical protein
MAMFHIDGQCGPIATTDKLVFAALGGTRAAGVAMRGEPGSALAAFATAADVDAPAWKLAFDATEWSVITALAVTPDGGVIVVGTFAGTLRAGARVVSSGGKTDGFVARVSPTGAPVWLIRVGGPGADAVQGVAVAPPLAGAATGAVASEQIAIAGTFAPGADLLGAPLAASNDQLPTADGFVAVLDGNGGRRWVQSFGGKEDEAVAGVAIDSRGRIAVAATVRDTVHVNGIDLTAQGPSDGLVAWWSATGEPGPAVLLGGADFDGLRAIAAVGDRVVVAGFYAGKLELGARSLTAAGGDDAFIAQLDGATGHVVGATAISGPGREDVTALAALPGGYAAAIAHTAALVLDGEATFGAPTDPLRGVALIARPLASSAR